MWKVFSHSSSFTSTPSFSFFPLQIMSKASFIFDLALSLGFHFCLDNPKPLGFHFVFWAENLGSWLSGTPNPCFSGHQSDSPDALFRIPEDCMQAPNGHFQVRIVGTRVFQCLEATRAFGVWTWRSRKHPVGKHGKLENHQWCSTGFRHLYW